MDTTGNRTAALKTTEQDSRLRAETWARTRQRAILPTVGDELPTQAVAKIEDTWDDWCTAWPKSHVSATGDGALRVRINRKVVPTFIRHHELGYQIVDGDDLWPVIVDSLILAGMIARTRQRMRQHPHHGSFLAEPCWLAPPGRRTTPPMVNVANPIVIAMGSTPRPAGGRLPAGRVAFYVFNGYRPQPIINPACRNPTCTNPAHLGDTPRRSAPC